MSSGLDCETAAIRRTIARCVEILKSFPPVDTFLGRKTQEPFPKENEEARDAGWPPPK